MKLGHSSCRQFSGISRKRVLRFIDNLNIHKYTFTILTGENTHFELKNS